MRERRTVWPLLVAAALVCGWTLLVGTDVYSDRLSTEPEPAPAPTPIHGAWADNDQPDADPGGNLPNWRGLTDQQVKQMSELGRVLFVDPSLRPPALPRNFTILVWKHGKMLERRHLRRFGDHKMDSDVPVPYGRTLALPADAAPSSQAVLPERRSRLAAIMGSNCASSDNRRWAYVKRLQQLLPGQLDVYGHCGTLSCPGHFTRDCPALSQYKFYLSFENSNCREYVTEKVWWNAYHHGAVPVVMGASQQDCRRLLPPGSYLHAADFASLADLARYLQHLDRSPGDYASFFRWRRRFRVLNEHGYFGAPTMHYCRLCEALNYNQPAPKVYNHLDDFWNASKDCYPRYYS